MGWREIGVEGDRVHGVGAERNGRRGGGRGREDLREGSVRRVVGEAHAFCSLGAPVPGARLLGSHGTRGSLGSAHKQSSTSPRHIHKPSLGARRTPGRHKSRHLQEPPFANGSPFQQLV